MDRSSPDAPPGPELPDFEWSDESSHGRRRGRRALWISIGALVALVVVAVPLIIYFARPQPSDVRTPSRVAGLTMDRQSGAAGTADYLRSAVAAGMNLDSSVGAVYTDGSGPAHGVIFVGGTTTTGTADANLKALFGMLDDGVDGVTDVTREAAGEMGGAVECALTTDSSVSDAAHPEPMAACGWADSDTVGLALFPNRSIAEAVILFGRMRPVLEDQN